MKAWEELQGLHTLDKRDYLYLTLLYISDNMTRFSPQFKKTEYLLILTILLYKLSVIEYTSELNIYFLHDTYKKHVYFKSKRVCMRVYLHVRISIYSAKMTQITR